MVRGGVSEGAVSHEKGPIDGLVVQHDRKRRSTGGSVIKTPDGKRWFARLRYTTPDGRYAEKKRTCPTHAAAKAMIGRLRDEIEVNFSERKTYRQLDEFYRERYLHEAVYRGGKKISGFREPLVNIRLYLNANLEWFGDMSLDEIRYPDLDVYKQHLIDKPKRYGGERSMADVNAHLKRLRRLFNIAVAQGWLVKSPFHSGDALVIDSHNVERSRVLTHEEEARLLAACTGKRRHIRPLIIFAIETAMRRGEIQRLLWSDVDLKARVIRVDRMNTKTMKRRLVPIFEPCRTVLAELRQNQLRPTSPVFGQHDFKHAFASALRAAGLRDLTFHDLRHTGITRMIEDKQMPIAVVMKISGHDQMKTFLRYVNQTEASMSDIAIQFDEPSSSQRAARYAPVEDLGGGRAGYEGLLQA